MVTVGIRCVLCLYETNCDPARQERDAFSRLFAVLWVTHVEVTGFHNRECEQHNCLRGKGKRCVCGRGEALLPVGQKSVSLYVIGHLCRW